MAISMCHSCGKPTKTVIMVPYCKHVPHGLMDEVKNHPGYDGDFVECTDACDPQEMTYEEFAAIVGDGKTPSDTFMRCAVCSCAKQE